MAAIPLPLRRAGLAGRFLDTLAGLLAAGILLVGIVLLVAAVIAPTALAAAGLGAADGPGWDRVIVHLAAGVAGELVVRFRGRWPGGTRVPADLAVVTTSTVLIWSAWWP